MGGVIVANVECPRAFTVGSLERERERERGSQAHFHFLFIAPMTTTEATQAMDGVIVYANGVSIQ